jgi:hypothetical protein
MRATVPLLSLLLACFGVACAATVNVAVDESADFSDYETWDWLPMTTPVGDGSPSLPPSLIALVAGSIEQGLHAQGLRRSSDRANFFVHYDVAVQRRAARVQQPFATQLVDSYNASASYWVEGTDTVTRMMTDLTLVIRVSEERGRTTWIGSLEQSVEEGTPVPVESAVEILLTRFAESRLGKRAGRGR